MMVLAGVGLKRLKVFRPSAFWIILAVGVIEFVLYSLFDDFTGSAAVSSRHFLPAALMLLIPAAVGVFGWWRAGGWKQALALTLTAWTMMQVWLCNAWPELRYLSPKIKLYHLFGFSPSVFPSLADGMTSGELVWSLAMLTVITTGMLAALKADER